MQPELPCYKLSLIYLSYRNSYILQQFLSNQDDEVKPIEVNGTVL